MSWTIRIAGVEEATAEVKAAVLLGERNGLEELGLRGVSLVKGMTPVGATGNLANFETMEMEVGAEYMKTVIFAGPPGDVYAAPVELGTRPHFPPVAALVPWVQKKFQPGDEKEAMSIAFAIARKIARRGTAGHFMFYKALEQLKSEAQPVLEKNIAVAIQLAGLAPR